MLDILKAGDLIKIMTLLNKTTMFTSTVKLFLRPLTVLESKHSNEVCNVIADQLTRQGSSIDIVDAKTSIRSPIIFFLLLRSIGNKTKAAELDSYGFNRRSLRFYRKDNRPLSY